MLRGKGVGERSKEGMEVQGVRGRVRAVLIRLGGGPVARELDAVSVTLHKVTSEGGWRRRGRGEWERGRGRGGVMEWICRVLGIAVVRGGMGVVGLEYAEGRKGEHYFGWWIVLVARWG